MRNRSLVDGSIELNGSGIVIAVSVKMKIHNTKLSQPRVFSGSGN